MRRILFIVFPLLALPAHADGTLRDAVERAWARQPAAHAQPARSEEFAARREAADWTFPAPPSLVIGQRTDRLNRNDGQHELEAEVSLPLWLPGERGRRATLVSTEQDQYDVGLATTKWRLAGEVREIYWQVRLADNDVALAQRRVEAAAALAADVARRVKAGDLARVDLNQVEAAERIAAAARSDAEVRAFKARQVFAALTGVTALPDGAEPVALPGAAPDENHPRLAVLQRAIATAQARLVQASQSLRNNPELELGMRRERGLFDEPYSNSVIVRFKLPFATDARNRPRITAANADLIEVQAAHNLERAKVSAEVDAARRELEQAQAVAKLAESRFTLAADTQRLRTDAFALGEVDLFARLRADNERYEAELQFTRAKLEAARAISRLSQALGVLP